MKATFDIDGGLMRELREVVARERVPPCLR